MTQTTTIDLNNIKVGEIVTVCMDNNGKIETFVLVKSAVLWKSKDYTFADHEFVVLKDEVRQGGLTNYLVRYIYSGRMYPSLGYGVVGLLFVCT